MFDWECPSDEMKALQVVTLPYNLLLHRDAREVLGIDLTNQVVVIDEAHSECFAHYRHRKS
jgi:Rad3-related DNA helicase